MPFEAKYFLLYRTKVTLRVHTVYFVICARILQQAEADLKHRFRNMAIYIESFCSDFRYESIGICARGGFFFSSDKLRLFN